MQAEPWMAQQPLLHFRGLVRGTVVADQVQVQPIGNGGVDELEEPQELGCPAFSGRVIFD